MNRLKNTMLGIVSALAGAGFAVYSYYGFEESSNTTVSVGKDADSSRLNSFFQQITMLS